MHVERTAPPEDATPSTCRCRRSSGRLHGAPAPGGGATTRQDFACEAGGDEWADSRPDPQRLEALARATGGAFVDAADAGALPLPKPTVVNAERHVTPLAPPGSGRSPPRSCSAFTGSRGAEAASRER